MPAQRLSNFELLRIIAMMLVLVVHACFVSVDPHGHAVLVSAGDALPKYGLLYVMESLALVCVNLFVIISGYFGIRLSLRSAAGLAFQLLFWCGIQGAVWLTIGRITWSQFALWLCGGGHSFVPCYFMLMLVAPVLNAFVDTAGRTGLNRFLLLYLAAQTVFGWAFEAWPFGSGSSLPLFIGLYMLGRRLSMEHDRRVGPAQGIAAYVSASAVIGLGVFALVMHVSDDASLLRHFTSYTSPANIACVAILLLAFKSVTFQSRLVNRLAKSAFAVYLAHMYPPMVIYYRNFFDMIFRECPTPLWPLAVLAAVCVIYIAVAMVDTLRIVAWRLLQRALGLGQ